MRKLIFNLHLYGALIAGLFVVIIGVTGSIMAFEEDLDRLANRSLYHVEPQSRMMPVADLLKAAQKAAGQRIGTIRLPQEATDSASFTVKGPRQVFIDPYTGAILGDRSPVTLLSKIHQLHLRLLMSYTLSSGKIGADVVTSFTAVLVFLVLSGVYLWWPLKRATVKWSANARRINFDLHNVAGIYSAAFLLVLGVTGIVVHFDDDLEEYFHKQAGTEKVGKSFASVPQPGGAPLSPDQSLEIAKAAMPGTKPLYVSVPGNPKASYLVGLHYPEDLTAGGRSWVNIDQFSGKVLGSQDSRTVSMATRYPKVTNRAIHTGDIYGYPSKILMSLSSLMLVIQAITGYYMWWKKLRVRQKQEESFQNAA